MSKSNMVATKKGNRQFRSLNGGYLQILRYWAYATFILSLLEVLSLKHLQNLTWLLYNIYHFVK